jgi:hypothetical protein
MESFFWSLERVISRTWVSAFSWILSKTMGQAVNSFIGSFAGNLSGVLEAFADAKGKNLKSKGLIP